MTILTNWLAGALLAGGAFFLLTGALGMVRLPDVFTRMHAGGMTETMGAGMILGGFALYSLADGWGVTARLLLILIFLWFTSPIASHAVARAALSGGIRPLTADGSGDAMQTDGGGVAGDSLPAPKGDASS